MLRSFSERIFGGVAGGLAAALHIGPWPLRVLWAVLIVASLGLMAVPYVLLWWWTPLESPVVRRQRGFPTVAALLVIAAGAALWAARLAGVLTIPERGDMTGVVVVVVLAVAFALRQFGGRAARPPRTGTSRPAAG